MYDLHAKTPDCTGCGSPMLAAPIKADKIGLHEFGTFVCPRCNRIQKHRTEATSIDGER